VTGEFHYQSDSFVVLSDRLLKSTCYGFKNTSQCVFPVLVVDKCLMYVSHPSLVEGSGIYQSVWYMCSFAHINDDSHDLVYPNADSGEPVQCDGGTSQMGSRALLFCGTSLMQGNHMRDHQQRNARSSPQASGLNIDYFNIT
jgi:hypothetical protein